MKRTKYVLRGTLLLLLVIQIVYLYQADNSFKEIVKFKYEAFKKAGDDSLRVHQKFDSLVNKTKKFNREISQESPHLKTGIRNLITIAVLLVIVEVSFAMAKGKS